MGLHKGSSRILAVAALLVFCAAALLGQLTADQKEADLKSLAALYAKQYAPYEWKLQVQFFDLYYLKPWIERARQSENDLEFYEVLAAYVNSLNDVHSTYLLPSSFFAVSGVGVDLYDGTLLIDYINRRQLPEEDFPFQIGDELVAVDGKPARVLMDSFERLVNYGNARSTQRIAADMLLYRSQAVFPRAIEIGENASLLIRRQSGELENFEVPWEKSGRPLDVVGPVPSPRPDSAVAPEAAASGIRPARWRKPWLQLQNLRGRDLRNVVGFGIRTPVYSPPQGFVQRLGRSSSDYFFSGTYRSEGVRIGLIRIPDFQPLPFDFLSIATRQFENEAVYMQANTDGLVIDVMRNPGGYGCWTVGLLARLMPRPFQSWGMEIRPNIELLNSYSQAIEFAREDQAEDWEIALLETTYNQINLAYSENRGRTGPVPICGLGFDELPATDQNGRPRYYSKPILLLTDEFSTSAADIFAAMFQDNARGPVFGYRTSGAGGSVTPDPIRAGFYSEGYATVTQSLITRGAPVVTPDFPVTYYIENVGVRPDIKYDYMTRQNLLEKGKPFVDAFTAAIKREIARNRP